MLGPLPLRLLRLANAIFGYNVWDVFEVELYDFNVTWSCDCDLAVYRIIIGSAAHIYFSILFQSCLHCSLAHVRWILHHIVPSIIYSCDSFTPVCGDDIALLSIIVDLVWYWCCSVQCLCHHVVSKRKTEVRKHVNDCVLYSDNKCLIEVYI